MMSETEKVWVFNGGRNPFPSAVFSSRERAEAWIKENKLSGTLTAYPVDVGVYDWAVSKGYFSPKRQDQKSPNFIAGFSSASQEHYHYQEGISPHKSEEDI